MGRPLMEALSLSDGSTVQVRASSYEKGSLEDLEAPLYQGRLWVTFSADSGGGSTKFTLEIASQVHMCGILAATDLHSNLEAFMRKGGDWVAQLTTLKEKGLEVIDRETEEVEVMGVELFLGGDMAFQAEILGHQGGAASFPCLKCLVTSHHLRKEHREGEPHALTRKACRDVLVTREVASYETNFLSNVRDRRQGGDLRKNGRHHQSIVARALFPLASPLHVISACLHIGLGVAVIEFLFLVTWAGILDGVTSEEEVERISERADPDTREEGEEVEEGAAEAELEAAINQMSPEQLQEMARKADQEKEWEAATARVEELEEEEKVSAEKVEKRESLMTRIKLAKEGKVEELQKLAKKRSKVRVAAKRFQPCDACLLTSFDKKVEVAMCQECEVKRHVFCQVESTLEEEDTVISFSTSTFVCRRCLPGNRAGYDNMERQVEEEVEELRRRSRETSRRLAEARLELSARKGKVVADMGPHRRQLEEVLNKIGARRQEYHSGAFVGNHVDKMVAKVP